MKVILQGNWLPLSALVRIFTASRWHHCGVIIDDYVIEASSLSGVVKTPLDKFKNRGKWAIMDIPLDDEKGAERWLHRQLGQPYDWSALIRFAIHRDWTKDKKWYCSELIGEALNLFNQRKAFNEEARGILPRDIAMLPYPYVDASL